VFANKFGMHRSRGSFFEFFAVSRETLSVNVLRDRLRETGLIF